MKLTGHKTESIYRRYAIVSEGDLSEGVKKLAALHQTQVDTPTARTLIAFPKNDFGQSLDKVNTRSATRTKGKRRLTH
jgi:hypothetical protein